MIIKMMKKLGQLEETVDLNKRFLSESYKVGRQIWELSLANAF